ncbi:MAG TPA: protease pro-enzyme activation domain-containing protein [Thermoplasmata archaeon]|nr:protease pro-enzyme activation domain-containing protein [Thermoplasmata archaeon]
MIGTERRVRARVSTLLALAILVLSTAAGSAAIVAVGASTEPIHGLLVPPLAALEQGPRAAVPLLPSDRPTLGAVPTDVSPSGAQSVFVSFAPSNQSALRVFLAALSDPSSPEYHEYLTAPEYSARYAPSPAAYATALEYFESFPVQDLQTFSDRAGIGFTAAPSVLAQIFGTTLRTYASGGSSYVAPAGSPTLPEAFGASVDQVSGLGTRTALLATTLSLERSSTAPAAASPSRLVQDGFLAPAQAGPIQYEYAPDFQVAYDEQSLFNTSGFPTNQTIATILWSGEYGATNDSSVCSSLSLNEAVGPYDPSDIGSFFNATLPAGEPHAEVFPVPLHDAPYPSPQASCDTTGAVFENTLDLEMAGSTAPGAHLYNIYVPDAARTEADFDDAIAFALSPNASESGLKNVSVISNSWGEPDLNDTAWMDSLEQAQARGITVLAASGDSDDSKSSSKYVGGPDWTEFPASMAYSTFGMTAVGGTVVTLNATTLELQNQTVWNESVGYTHGDPVGSTGGISSVFPEPSWQRTTSANVVIGGAGRGVPDIAGLANDTLVTFSVNGERFNATNATHGGVFYFAAGTSVATPLAAGLIATIDRALLVHHDPAVGFLDPNVYRIANVEYTPIPTTPTTGDYAVPQYNSSLPARPFQDVLYGSNYAEAARTGYSLVTGWGSLDAYNYTIYVLSVSSDGVKGHLTALQDRLDLTGLAVTSTLPSFVGGGINTYFNASTQQNFFVADSLGAPIYWIQNVIYISGTPGDWAMNFSGWVVYPFWGIYPALAGYEYNFPVSGLIEPLPLDLNLTTSLSNPGGFDTQSVTFSFGAPGTPALSLPVPGASYILGSLNATFSWEGTWYTNGPYAGVPANLSGFLAPQFGLVGGPSYGIGNFLPPTGGTLSAWIEPSGVGQFLAAATELVTPSFTQTGESSSNLTYAQVGGNVYQLQYGLGSTTQGVAQYEGVVPETQTVQFNETGAPLDTSWFVNLSTGLSLEAPGTDLTISTTLVAGLYGFAASESDPNVVISPDNGSFRVVGATVYIDLAITPATGTVLFVESDLPTGTSWFINVTGGPRLSSSGTEIEQTLTVGLYDFTVTDGNASWAPPEYVASVDVAVGTNRVPITFHLVLFGVTFHVLGPAGEVVDWNLSVDGQIYESGPAVTSYLEFPNGTHHFVITGVSAGFTVSPASGSFPVEGAPVTVAINFSANATAPPPAPTYFGLGLAELVAIAALVAIGLLAVALVATRRRRPPEPRRDPPAG